MRNFIVIILLFIAFNSNASDTTRYYFDANWKKISQEKAVFYRKKFKNNQKIWTAFDYYKNGQIQMSGTYASKKLKSKEGNFVYYYKNGQRASEGNYSKNKRTGNWKFWHDNGLISSEGEFVDGFKSGEWKYWFDNGVPSTNGKYDSKGLETGYWKKFHKNGNIDAEGNYVKGKYNDVWKFYFNSGKISAIETYQDSVLTDIKFWNEGGSVEDKNLIPEIMPKYIGGEEALYKYLFNTVNYPKSARDNNIQGTVYIKFIIGYDGSVEDVDVVRSVNPLLDAEALKVIKEMPKWTIAKSHNRPARVTFTLPIKFKLK